MIAIERDIADAFDTSLDQEMDSEIINEGFDGLRFPVEDRVRALFEHTRDSILNGSDHDDY